MVSCFSLSQCTKFFRTFDFFQSSKLLRYNGDAEYKSTTGGITSVLIVAIFIALFSSMGLKTVQKEIIFSSTTTEREADPSETTVTFGPGHMMFAIMIR